MPGPGERAVANHDEDSLTLAVNAALALPAARRAAGCRLLRDRPRRPTPRSRARRRSRRCSICRRRRAPLDFTRRCAPATSALLAALDVIAARRAAARPVAAADCRWASPSRPAEQSFGDAGAALLVGAGAGSPRSSRPTRSPRSSSAPGARASRTSRARSRAPSRPSSATRRCSSRRRAGVLEKAGVPAERGRHRRPADAEPARAARGREGARTRRRSASSRTASGPRRRHAAPPSRCCCSSAALERARPGDLILCAATATAPTPSLLRATGAAPWRPPPASRSRSR